MKSESPGKLHQVLTNEGFAVTAECGPPRGADPEIIRKKGTLLKDCVDAVNVTDNQTAIVRMSSIAACAHLSAMGIEPVMQMVTRDRNRIALQSDIMGAYSLGITNILCLTGDHQSFGSQPDAMNVFRHRLDESGAHSPGHAGRRTGHERTSSSKVRRRCSSAQPPTPLPTL